MTLQRKIYEANKAVSTFLTNEWTFKNDNFWNLNKFIRIEDTKQFNFMSAQTFDIFLIARNGVLGLRRYVLNEKDEDLPRARVFYKRMKLMDQVVKKISYVILFYLLFIANDYQKILRDNNFIPRFK
jgi:alcohol-forming fatty acyl-CoA reductase